MVDSSGFSIAKYIDWQSAKYGKLSVRLFAKLHILHMLHDPITRALAAWLPIWPARLPNRHTAS